MDRGRTLTMIAEAREAMERANARLSSAAETRAVHDSLRSLAGFTLSPLPASADPA